MTVRHVLKRGDSSLHRPCVPVTDIAAVDHVITDLRDTLMYLRCLYEFRRGAGISANQIGYFVCISVIYYRGHEYVLINPRVIDHSLHTFKSTEGCLSFFDYRSYLPRWLWLKVGFTTASGQTALMRAQHPDLASLLQHELDHLAGRLYLERQTRAWWRCGLKPRLRRKAGVPAIP